jgi:hypothetical protein
MFGLLIAAQSPFDWVGIGGTILTLIFYYKISGEVENLQETIEEYGPLVDKDTTTSGESGGTD